MTTFAASSERFLNSLGSRILKHDERDQAGKRLVGAGGFRWCGWPKRCLDILFSLAALVLLGPLICMVALAVIVGLGRPVLFWQHRSGRQGRVFNLVKFRTMRADAVSSGPRPSDEERLTPFGLGLRRTSLDELPQLWNVLKGDMSLIGPRPLPADYMPFYTPEQARRHEVRPGLTGWAQVNGRNATSWDERFVHDLFYVEKCDFRFDLRIALLTLRQLLSGTGISQEGHVTMPRFDVEVRQGRATGRLPEGGRHEG